MTGASSCPHTRGGTISIKKGVTVQLALLNVQVSVTKAVDEPKSASFTTICAEGHDPTATKAPLHCPTCGNQDRKTFKKGKNIGTSRSPEFVLVTPEEVAAANASKAETDTMPLAIHPALEVHANTIANGRVYHLEPMPGQEQAYRLLTVAVEHHPDLAFLTRWAARSATALYRLEVREDALMIRELAWPETLVNGPMVTGTVDTVHMEMVDQIIAKSTAPFDKAAYADARSAQLEQLVAARAGTPGATLPTAQPAGGGVPDLLAALKASVEAA